MKIGERIRQRRKEIGLSVDELAEILGKNRATVYRYESNEIEKLPTTVLEPLAKALKTTPAYLMGWEDESENEIQNTNEEDIQLENTGLEKSRIELIARHLADVPEEDREQLINNFEQTIEIYLKAKGIKKSDNN